MSLKYRNSQGVETPVAGLNGQNGSLVPSVALQKSGTLNIPATAASGSGQLSVTFDAPFEDTDYTVNFETIGNAWYNLTLRAEKTVNGFTLVYQNVDKTASSSTATVKWTAYKLMTDTVHEADAAHIAQNTANFAPAFSEVTSYAVGDYVTYNNVLYRCTTAHTAGTWVSGHFTQVTVGGDLNAIVPSDASASNKLATYTAIAVSSSDTITTLLSKVKVNQIANVNTSVSAFNVSGISISYLLGTLEKFSNGGLQFKGVAQDASNNMYDAVLWFNDATVIIANPQYSYIIARPTSSVTSGSTAPVTSGGVYSSLAIKKMDISATGGATSFSATIPLSMAQRNKPFYLEVLSVGNNNTIKEMKYLVFVSSINTTVTTKEISKDSVFTNVSITFNESTGYELSFSSTDTLYSTTVYTQQ